jgi:hypothetical protein
METPQLLLTATFAFFTGCSKPLTAEEQAFVEEALSVSRSSLELSLADMEDMEDLDLPVRSMSEDNDEEYLNKKAVQMRLGLLPTLMDNLNVETNVVKVKNCGDVDHAGGCVDAFDYENLSHQDATKEEILEGAEDVEIKLTKWALEKYMAQYKNGDDQERLDALCTIGGKVLGHELTHTSGIDHNDNLNSWTDVAYEVGEGIYFYCNLGDEYDEYLYPQGDF